MKYLRATYIRNATHFRETTVNAMPADRSHETPHQTSIITYLCYVLLASRSYMLRLTCRTNYSTESKRFLFGTFRFLPNTPKRSHTQVYLHDFNVSDQSQVKWLEDVCAQDIQFFGQSYCQTPTRTKLVSPYFIRTRTPFESSFAAGEKKS